MIRSLLIALLIAGSAFGQAVHFDGGSGSSGVLNVIAVTVNTTRTMTAAESGSVVQLGNGSTDQPSGVTLPPASPGTNFRLVLRYASGSTALVFVDATGTDTIFAEGSTGSAGGYVKATSGNTYSYVVHVDCIESGKWTMSDSQTFTHP